MNISSSNRSSSSNNNSNSIEVEQINSSDEFTVFKITDRFESTSHLCLTGVCPRCSNWGADYSDNSISSDSDTINTTTGNIDSLQAKPLLLYDNYNFICLKCDFHKANSKEMRRLLYKIKQIIN
jgi:hypothetical protein